MRRLTHALMAGIISLLVLTAGLAAAADEAGVLVGKVATPPVLDGGLDEAAWANAALLAPFLLNDGASLASQQTEVLACYDAEALYLGFRCWERSLEPMTQQLHLVKAEATEHDGRVFGDESVEIFVQPGASGAYYQLAANMIGTRYESVGMDSSFDADWRTAASADTRSWYLEVAIPFAAFGAQTPAAGEQWGFNICRNQNPNNESSTWSGLRGAFHSPEQFGRLVFSDTSAQVRLSDLGDLSVAASALRLNVGPLPQAAGAELLVRADSLLKRRSPIAVEGGEVAVPYPLAVSQVPPSVRYQVLLEDGSVLYRSAWFPQSSPGLTLGGSLTVDTGSAVVSQNGRQIGEIRPGGGLEVSSPLSPGENVIAITVNGATRIGGALECSEQVFGFDRGWRWFPTITEGWDGPDFPVDGWAALPAAGADGFVTLPRGAVCLRRVVAVGDRRERFWPLQPDAYLPRGSKMFLKPLLQWVGEPPDNYVYNLDLPEPIKVVAVDGLDGVQLRVLPEQRVEHDGKPYTRYAMTPIGTLTGGFTLELVWKNKSGTSAQYVSALSLGGDFDWRDFEVELTAPPFGELVGVLPLKWQNRGVYGTCWYDDISLTEKGSDVNLIPEGDFESERWVKDSHAKGYLRNGKPNNAVRLSGTKEQVGQQTGVWVSTPTIEVKPNTRYVLRLRAKGEGIKSPHTTGRASIVVDVGEPKADTLTAYSHFEGLDGHIIEAQRASTIHILPAMRRRAPKQVPIIVCYAASAYESPVVNEANAEMVLDAGVNWLWGSNEGELAELVKPHGMKFVWHIPRNGYDQSPVDREYLTRHPEHKAVKKSGALDEAQICPTILLDTDNEFIPAMQKWFADRIRENPYDMIDWDHEFPVTYDGSICLCDRCRKAFAEWAGLDAVPSAEAVFEHHKDRWVDFRCLQNARMAGAIRDACKAANPDIPFSVYSGFATDRTKWLYGVDWARMKDSIDWGIGGYNGDRATIQKTLGDLGELPFTTGCMYVEQRFATERAYPTLESWRTMLMRSALDSEGHGFLIWYLPVLDGAGYWGIGWVSALIAEYEDFFTDFNRRDELVQSTPELDETKLAVLVKGSERLIIVMNPSASSQQVELKLRSLPRGPKLVEYETGVSHNPLQPVVLDLAPGDIRALHLTSG